MKFYTTESLGPNQSLTPEGYLLCEATPVARTGTMDYGPGETPVSVGPEGFVEIQRTPEEVFRPETIASLAGKAVTDGHPDSGQFVTTDNWRRLAQGVVMNPRRGTGDQDDLLLADLVIYDPELIKLIRDGKREVSAGYEAEYNEIKPGLGLQYDIVMNHVALVDQGRCGQRCAIGDQQRRSASMARTTDKRRKGSVFDRLRTAFKAKDESEFEQALEEAEENGETGDEAPDDETHVHLHVPGGAAGEDAKTRDDEFSGRLDALEAGHKAIMDKLDTMMGSGSTGDEDEEAEKKAAEEAKAADEATEELPEEKRDEAKKATDSAYFSDVFQDVVAGAEILVPGIRVPTFDAKASPKKTADAMCGLRRDALRRAMEDGATAALVISAHGSAPQVRKLTCDQARTLFRAAVALKKAENTRARAATGDTPRGNPAAPVTLREMNKRNADFWNKHLH